MASAGVANSMTYNIVGSRLDFRCQRHTWSSGTVDEFLSPAPRNYILHIHNASANYKTGTWSCAGVDMTFIVLEHGRGPCGAVQGLFITAFPQSMSLQLLDLHGVTVLSAWDCSRARPKAGSSTQQRSTLKRKIRVSSNEELGWPIHFYLFMCVHAYQCYRRGVTMFTVLSRLYIGWRIPGSTYIYGHVQPLVGTRHMENPQYNSIMGVHSSNSSRALPNPIKLSGWWSGYLA
jgi:hypothetical protein